MADGEEPKAEVLLWGSPWLQHWGSLFFTYYLPTEGGVGDRRLARDQDCAHTNVSPELETW